MKLTILALALSTYRCGASSRKLPAVAEADEEDNYYDGEVNTYYDDYGDADKGIGTAGFEYASDLIGGEW